MRQDLLDNQIIVISYYSDNDGFYHISVCGTPTGNIHIFEIHKNDYTKSIKLGFKNIDSLLISDYSSMVE